MGLFLSVKIPCTSVVNLRFGWVYFKSSNYFAILYSYHQLIQSVNIIFLDTRFYKWTKTGEK